MCDCFDRKDIDGNNKIIATYMRDNKPPPPNWSWDYHKSWDDLLPVIDKIICEDKTMFYFTAPNYVPGIEKYSFSISPDTENPIKEKGLTMLEIAYEGVVKYIKRKQL